MKIRCHCGETIFDAGDELPQKGHLISDQDWFATFDGIDDEVIVPLADGDIDREQAFHLSRAILGRLSRRAYQCRACGRLYIEQPSGDGLQCYVPSDEETSKEILRSRGGRGER